MDYVKLGINGEWQNIRGVQELRVICNDTTPPILETRYSHKPDTMKLFDKKEKYTLFLEYRKDVDVEIRVTSRVPQVGGTTL